MDIKHLIDGLYKIVREYEGERSDRFTDKINALYSQIDILEAIENGTTESVIKDWYIGLLQDKPRNDRG